MAERTLLHVCCAPCAMHPAAWLDLRGIAWSGFFFNPNIQPAGEYDLRLGELRRVAGQLGWRIEVEGGGEDGWRAAVAGLEREPERGERCRVCFSFRLERAFAHARRCGYARVATTLTVGRFKSSAQVLAVGEELSLRHEMPFLAVDFKKNDGYEKGRRLAKSLGVRVQTHCGCVYSLAEANLRRRRA